MPDRPYPRSGRRSIVDYNQLVTDSTEYIVLCVNKAVVGVAREFLLTRGLWPTTYAVNYGNDGYDLPTLVQMDLVEELISEFLEDTNDMDCTDFANSLTAIRDAISALSSGAGCGCGSGDAGSDDPPASGQTVDPPGTPGGTVPPGFADLAEYEDYKCDVADWIVQSMRSDIFWMSAATIGTMPLVVFAGLLITPVPGARVAALLFAVIALSGLAAGVFTSFLNAIDNNASALKCALYEATDVSDAKTDFESTFDTAVDAETADLAWRFAIKSVFDLFVSNHNINKLFVKDEFTSFPAATCTDCGVPQWWDTSYGTLIDYGSDWADFETLQVGNDWWVGCGVQGDCPTNKTYNLSVVNGAWTNPSQAINATFVEQCPHDLGAGGGGDPGLWDVSYTTFNGGPHTGVICQVRSDSKITVRFTRS